ncbi:MAG TPA: hypothetical protein VI819_04165 [Patescibacteria group bacterium]|nr:hypothetical protein [Patescibacteria group bacterium]
MNERPNPFGRLKYLGKKARSQLEQIVKSDDPRIKKEIQSELEIIGEQLGERLFGLHWPKTLLVKTNGVEYISERRIDSNQLKGHIEVTDQEGDRRDAKHLRVLIPRLFLNKEQIAILVRPYNYQCSNPDTIKAVIGATGKESYMEDFDEDAWDAMHEVAPKLYKPEEWKPTETDLILAKRGEYKLYTIAMYPLRGNRVFYTGLKAEKFDRKNDLGVCATLGHGVYLTSGQEVDVYVEGLVNYGSIYVLNKGSSEKEAQTFLNTNLRTQKTEV